MMKIPPTNTPPPNAPATRPDLLSPHRKTSSKRTDSSSQTKDAASGNTGVGGRDFASVLHEAVRPRDSQDEQGNDDREDDRTAARRAERDDRERDVRQRGDDDRSETGAGGNFGNRASVARESAIRGESAAAARAILHIADLERIVAAVRAQTLAGGRREVTLELQRSVLEGLRIKISTDEAGRITAEFIAATERVRSQLDARSGELAEVLRSRGVNLASLRTTLDGENSSGQNDSRGQRNSAAIESARGAGNVASTPDGGDDENESPPTDGATYRA